MAVLLEFYRPQKAHHVFGWETVKHNIVLYTDNTYDTERNGKDV